jgi:membrane protease subunit HflK
MNKAISGVIVLVIIIALGAFIVMDGIYNLGNTEQAVIQRFGEVINIVEEPGIHFKIPFIDEVTTINVKDLRSIQYGYRIDSEATTTSAATYTDVEDEAVILTNQGEMVDVGAIVQYRIVDAEQYLFNCDDQEETIRLAFESVLRRNFQNKDLTIALVNKEDIAVEVLPELQAKLNTYGLGIRINSVKLTDVLVPAEVQDAYDGVNIATNEADALILQAQKYSNENIPAAEAQANVLINEAKQYRETIVAQANGEVAAFVEILKNYENAKEITTTRLFLETMEKVLAKTDKKYIFDMDSEGVLKHLPIGQTTN